MIGPSILDVMYKEVILGEVEKFERSMGNALQQASSICESIGRENEGVERSLEIRMGKRGLERLITDHRTVQHYPLFDPRMLYKRFDKGMYDDERILARKDRRVVRSRVRRYLNALRKLEKNMDDGVMEKILHIYGKLRQLTIAEKPFEQKMKKKAILYVFDYYSPTILTVRMNFKEGSQGIARRTNIDHNHFFGSSMGELNTSLVSMMKEVAMESNSNAYAVYNMSPLIRRCFMLDHVADELQTQYSNRYPCRAKRQKEFVYLQGFMTDRGEVMIWIDKNNHLIGHEMIDWCMDYFEGRLDTEETHGCDIIPRSLPEAEESPEETEETTEATKKEEMKN